MAKLASGPTYPLSALRALALHAQRLATPNALSPDAIVELAKALGYIQIDTLHVVNRAHYITLWARFGSYDIEQFHRLIYTPNQRRLYEGWGHAACIIPLEHFRFHQWRADPSISYNAGFHEWAARPGNRELTEQTLARIRADGSLRVADLEYDGPQRGPWYDWKPPKVALEALFAWGDLMVADRVNFHRVYDVRERVLPDWVDLAPADGDAGRRFCFEQAAKALGVFEARHLTSYAYLRATPAKALLRSFVEDGPLVEIQGETMAGVQKWLVHRDNLPLLQQAADGELRPERTTFLAPFDSLFWAPGRDEKLWGFEQLLECYKPADQRVYGYFSLPILYKERLIGRFDPKLERKAGVMRLNAIYLEPGVEPDEEMVAAVAGAMRDFLAWHGASSLTIEKSEPATFGDSLLRAY